MNTVAVSATSAYLVANAAMGEAAMPALTEGFTRGFYVGAGCSSPRRWWCSS